MSPDCPNCGAKSAGTSKFCPECGASILATQESLVGEMLASRYRIIEKIGEGSMGKIYLAEHTSLEKQVAVKVLHREVELEEEASVRFRREGMAASKIKHKNAIEVYDFDKTPEGIAYLAMEYVDGADLRALIDQNDPVPYVDAEEIILQVLAALQAAHELGIVHRDVKPANIMTVGDAEPPQVKVLDFGLSKLVHRKIEASLTTMPGRIIGTPLYMAPEQASGEEADHRSDLYAIGLIFYELLCGSRPFTGKSLTELLYAQATQPVPSIFDALPGAKLPKHLDDFFVKALDRDKDERFQSADEMAEALVGKIKIPDRPTRERDRFSAAGESGPARKKSAAWIPFAAVAALALVGAGVFFALGGSGPEPEDTARYRVRNPRSLNAAENAYLDSLGSVAKALAAGDGELALTRANAAAADRLRDPEADLWRARAQLATGQEELAIISLQDAIAGDETFGEARADLGWLLLGRGDSSDAREQFDLVKEPAVARADALAGLAVIAKNDGQFGESAELIEQAVKASRASWRASLVQGQDRLDRLDYERAVLSFNAAKNRNGRAPEIVLGLASAYLGAGQADEAEEQFEAALATGSANADILLGMAAMKLARNDFEGALVAMNKLGASARREPETAALRAAADLGRDKIQQALSSLGSIEGEGVAAGRAFALRASLELQQDDLDAALASATEAVTAAPDLHFGHYFRGVALFRLERFDEAVAAIDKVLVKKPSCAEAWLLRGVLYMDYVLAENSYSTAYDSFNSYQDADGEDPRVDAWLERLNPSNR